MAKLKNRYCLVRLVKKFLHCGEHHKNSLLVRRVAYGTKIRYVLRRQKLSYTHALELVHKQLKGIGLNPKKYGLHSMHSGGVSLAAAIGVPECNMVDGSLSLPKTATMLNQRGALLNISQAFSLN